MINLGIKVPPDALIQAYLRAQAGRHRAFRPAGEERAADGDHGGRSARRRHSACRCWWAARRFPTNSPAPKSRPAYGEAVCYAKDAMTGLSLMNQLDGPGRARSGAGSAHGRPPIRRLPSRRGGAAGPAGHAAQRQSAHRHSDSRRALSGPQGARRAAPGGSVELHQPVHAVRPAPGLQGQFRKGSGASTNRKRWNCTTTWKK